MFKRFAAEARRAVVLAQLEARALNHNYIGTEHLLLALTVEDLGLATRVLAASGITRTVMRDQVVNEIGLGDAALSDSDAEALRAIGIDLEEVRRRVEETFGPFALSPARPCKKGSVGQIPFTPKSTRALKISLHEARRMGHNYLGPEHILLALLKDEKALAAKLIRRVGTTPQLIRRRLLAAMREAS